MTNCKCKCNHHSKQQTNLEKYEETHMAEAFVLTCIDYRFIESLSNYLESGPLSNKYDLTALAGASLAYNQTKFEYWRQTIIDQIKLAIELHHINQIVIFDHMDCGAYLLFYPDIEANSEEERLLHIKNIKKAIRKLKELFPDLIYSGYILNFDGVPELVAS